MATFDNDNLLGDQEDVAALDLDDRSPLVQEPVLAEGASEPVSPVNQEERAPVLKGYKGVVLYKAQIEGVVYPRLTLEALQRWVREGRLLEEDLIALDESDDFKAALDYPEIESCFDVFSAKQKTLKESEAKVAPKKGFWNWLRSLFKRS